MGAPSVPPLAAFLDLLAQLGDRSPNTVPAFQEPAELERQLLIDRGGEGHQSVRAPSADSPAHVLDLAGQQLERIHIVAKALGPFPLLTDRLL